MTNIKENIASKLAVALVAVAMVFSAFAPATQAQTTEELQAMINDLLAQVAALQATSAGTTVGGTCVTIPAPLTIGSEGANVTALQNFLITAGESIPAGATGYFGAQTRAALASWQGKNGVMPAAGYYGPITMAAIEAKCVPDPVEDEDDEDMEEDDEDMELSGEGTLETFEMDDASDTDIPEGAEDEVIAEITMEATDGDIEVDRLTLVINDGSVANTESDPWEVFETITLWVDGDMIAEFDASDEDEYLEEDDGEFRFSGLGLVLMEDEEVEVLVGATVVSSVDDAGSATLADWEIFATEVRYFDADGVSEDDNTTDELDSNLASTASASFEIVEEGDGEELTFSLGSNNPDATDIVVDTDSDTNGVTVLEYTIEAEEADIELNTLFVDILTSATSSSVIDDVVLEIDGEMFSAENNPSASANTTKFEFDIDGDIVIDMDEEVTVAVMVDFRSQESSNDVPRYANGTTIKATADVDDTDAEGADDIAAGDLNGSAVGEQHTLVAEGIVVPVDGVETETDTTGDNDQTGTFTIDFEVTAVEGDFYIYERATAGAFNATTTGVTYSVDGPAGYTATTSGTLSSTADQESSDFFVVREGETETFTLVVTVDTNTTGQHRVSLTGVGFSDDEVAGDADDEAYATTPAQDFRTSFININAN